MTRENYVLKNIKNVSPEIRRAVVEDARARGKTIRDVVGEALAEMLDLQYVSSDDQSPGTAEMDGSQFLLRLPQDMITRIYVVSRAQRVTQSSVVLSLLAKRYAIPYEPVRRDAPRPKRRARVG